MNEKVKHMKAPNTTNKWNETGFVDRRNTSPIQSSIDIPNYLN